MGGDDDDIEGLCSGDVVFSVPSVGETSEVFWVDVEVTVSVVSDMEVVDVLEVSLDEVVLEISSEKVSELEMDSDDVLVTESSTETCIEDCWEGSSDEELVLAP